MGNIDFVNLFPCFLFKQDMSMLIIISLCQLKIFTEIFLITFNISATTIILQDHPFCVLFFSLSLSFLWLLCHARYTQIQTSFVVILLWASYFFLHTTVDRQIPSKSSYNDSVGLLSYCKADRKDKLLHENILDTKRNDI